MNAYYYFFFCILCVSSLEGSALVKKSGAKVISKLFVVSSEGSPFQLDPIWVQESDYIAKKIQEDSELGTEKIALELPVGLEQLEKLNSFLLKLKNGTKRKLKKDFMLTIANSDRSPTELHSKVRELHQLFKSIKLMGIKKLHAIALAGFLFLLKKESVLTAFAQNPSLIDELDLPSELTDARVKLLSDEDQEFLSSQLCVTAKSQRQPSCAAVSSSGRYAVTGGIQKKETSFFELFDTLTGDSIRQVVIEGKIKGIHFCQDDQIIIWNKKRVDLWNPRGTAKCTPSSWEELTKDSKRIWSIALSADKKTLALVLDEKILVLPIPSFKDEESADESQRIEFHRTLVSPAMYKKENKKSGHSKIVFAKGDQILIEVRPGGDLLFYRWDKQMSCFAYKKGSGTDIRRYYVCGSKFVTISDAHEARVWDCQEDTVEALNEGKMLPETPDFVSQEEFIQIKKNDKKIFCDTRSNEFIDKLAFLTGEKLSASILIDSGLPAIVRNDQMGDRFQSLSFPISQYLVGAFTSCKGSVLLGLADQGLVKIWHINNPDLTDFLKSSMDLEQALFIQYLVSQIRAGKSSMEDFMGVSHMRKIFEGCDKTFRMLLLTTFPELRTGWENRRVKSPRSSSHMTLQSSTSRENNSKILQGISLSSATSSPLHSPRLQSPRYLEPLTPIEPKESDDRRSFSPRKGSNDSTRSVASDGLQSLPRSRRTSLHGKGSGTETALHSPRGESQTIEIAPAPPDILLKESEIVFAGSVRSSSSYSSSSQTAYTEELDLSEESSLKTAPDNFTTSSTRSSERESLSKIQINQGDSSHNEVLSPEQVICSPRVIRQAVELILVPSKEPEIVLVGDQTSSSNSLLSSVPLENRVHDSGGVLEEGVCIEERVNTEFLPLASGVLYEVAGAYLPEQEAFAASCALHAQREYDAAYKTFSDIHEYTNNKLRKALSAHYLGDMNLYGLGVECNPSIAFSYFKKASKQSENKALLAETFARLGEMYSYGYGVKQSQMQALYYLNQIVAHEQDPLIGAINDEAPFKTKISALFLLHRAKLFILHRAKSQKLGTNSNLKEATILYEKACELCEAVIKSQGSDAFLAHLYKGRLYLTQLKESTAMIAKAWGCFMRASNSSDTYIKAEAFYRLGKLSMHTVKSSGNAKDFFEKALIVSSQMWITPMVELHLGHLAVREEAAKRVPSYAKAIEYYEKALRQPFNLWAQSESSYQLARMYEKSTDLNLPPVKVWEKILEYDTQAVAVGEVFGIHHVDAHLSIARQHYRGTPALAHDLTEAFKQYMIVLNEGHDTAQLIEACLALAEIAQKRDKSSLAREMYQKILSLREEEGYRPSDQSRKHILKALLEEAKYEFSSAKQFTSHQSDAASATSHDSLATANSLLKDLLELSPTQEVEREAKLLQVEIKKSCTKKL